MTETTISAAEELFPYEIGARTPVAKSAAKLSFFFLCLFTVAVYGRPEDIFPVVGQLHLTLILGACAAVSFIGSLFSGNASLLRSRELPYMLLLTAWFMAGVPFAYWRGGSFQILTEVWAKTLLIFFLLTQTLVSLARVRLVLWAIIFSELAVSAYSILNPAASAWIGDRMSGISLGILGWNFLGIAAALTIPYIAALFIDRPSFINSCLLAATTIAMLWMLVLTASRSGVLTVAFSIALTWLSVLRGTARGKAIGIVLIIALVGAICVAPGVFWQRMQTMWSSSSPTTMDEASAQASEDERAEALKRSIRYTIEHPIFGLGLGNFSAASGNEIGQPNAWIGAHNSYTELSSEGGIPALLIFLAMMSVTIVSMRRIGRADYAGPEGPQLSRMARATWCSLVSFLFGACFAHISYEYFLYYPVAFAAGIEYIAARTLLSADSQTTLESSESFEAVPLVSR